MLKIKRLNAITAALFLLILLCACGSAKEDYASYEAETMAAAAYDYAEESSMTEYSMKTAGVGYIDNNEELTEEDFLENNLSTDAAEQTERKLIRNINVSLETEKFDLVKETIKNNIRSCGGYIESSSEYLGNYYSDSGRNASISARIPAEQTDQFINSSFQDAYITSMSESTEDITLRYSDLETRLQTLEAERDSLISLMQQAEDVESIIALEERLSEVRYELESIHSNLKNYDNHVSYSTVWIDISEVNRIEASPKATFGERIAGGFISGAESFLNGLADFTVWFISNIFFIILFAALITGAVLLIRKARKNRMYEKKNSKTNEISEENKN